MRADTRDVRPVVQPKCAQSRDAGNDPASNEQPGMSTVLRSVEHREPGRPGAPRRRSQHREIGTFGLRDGGLTSRVRMRAPDRVGSASDLPPIWLLLAFYLARIWRLYPSISPMQ